MNEIIAEIVKKDEDSRREFEANTDGGFANGAPVKIAALRKAFESIEDRSNWKGPINVVIPVIDVELVVESIKFFHADDPKVIYVGDGTARIEGKGYQAW